MLLIRLREDIKALASAVSSDQTFFRDDCMSRLDDAHFERGEGFPEADG